MKRLLIILGFIASILAVVLSVTPFFKIAYLPAIGALIFGLLSLYISDKRLTSKKSIHLILLLTIISLTVVTYKVIFNVTSLGNVDSLELKEKASEEDALKALEGLDLETLDVDPDKDGQSKLSDSITVKKGS
jgi:membrane-bound ClpP family serine protease